MKKVNITFSESDKVLTVDVRAKKKTFEVMFAAKVSFWLKSHSQNLGRCQVPFLGHCCYTSLTESDHRAFHTASNKNTVNP